jgi:hypothetical protein
VYLTVFVGGLLARGDDLEVMGRAMGLTLITAVLGKIGLSLAARASQPVELTEEGQLDEPEGPIGSLDDEALSTNVAEQEEDWANAA